MSKIEIVPDVKFVTARSSSPSPLKSADASEVGPSPPLEKGLPGARVNPPVPFPKSSEIVLSLVFVTAMSVIPSQLNSPNVISRVPPIPPVGKGLPAASANAPVPFPKSTETALLLKSVTARSRNPSPLKSVAMISANTDPPLGNGLPGPKANVPAPFPKNTAMVPVEFETARSANPSPLKSSEMTAVGEALNKLTLKTKLPVPLPINTATLPSWFETARSGIPSPLKSAEAISDADKPALEKGLPGARVNVPVPFPKNTETVLPIPFTTARSGNPSPLKSSEIIESGLRPLLEKGLPGARAKPPEPFPKNTEILAEV
ncbi:hypothetical protein P4452_17930 [Cytobacillus praedii]|nr:hypothetical protein [Cytobacillus praedii]